CGFSFGSVLGALAAALRDGRTASYTMVGAGNRGLGVRRGIMEPLLKQTPEMTDEERHEVHFENLARLMFKHRKNIDEFAIWLQMRNVPRTRIKSRRMEGDNNQRDAIERIDCPVNAIWGDGDATAHPYWDERREVLREVHPDVELHLVPEAGHWVAYEATDVLNDLLIRLLKAVPDRPGRRGG
ncbi:MAG: alpha/beta hydrolase, partial [Acetobacterales bacterium]